MRMNKLKDIATVDLSNVDKKSSVLEKEVKLCNYTDVYKNWAITSEHTNDFMIATAKENEIEKFSLKKGQVAITKDSEKRNDIGKACYISENFDNILLGYHCALITPNENFLNGKFLNVFLHSNMAQQYFENHLYVH